jgi:hypothetical protein
MTYRVDCGGQKFFRNLSARCGENAARDCKCGGSQNSHLKIRGVFGEGTPITGNPTSELTNPVPGPLPGGNFLISQVGVRAAKSGVRKHGPGQL